MTKKQSKQTMCDQCGQIRELEQVTIRRRVYKRNGKRKGVELWCRECIEERKRMKQAKKEVYKRYGKIPKGKWFENGDSGEATDPPPAP